MKKKLLFLLTCFLGLFLVLANGYYACSQTKPVTGLRFSSHEVIKDERTSLNLTPEQPFSFSDGFSMEFDAMFRPGDGDFGYVFRIIGDEKANIDLVTNLGSSATTFSLIFKEMVLFTYKWEDVPMGDFGSWIKIKLQLDHHSNLTISLNGNSKKKKIEELADTEHFNIEFGACKYSSFLTTDVAPMTIKDILIYDNSRKFHRNWKLARHRQDYVYDEINHSIAAANNPNWEINKHLKWKKERSFQLDELIGVAKDEETGRVFLVDNKAVYVVKPQTFSIDSTATIPADTMGALSIDTLTFTKGAPFPCEGNQIVYNPLTDEIWSYSFTSDSVSRFNFITRSWSLSEPDCQLPDLWHHNSLISPADSSLTTFGGYGFFTYKSFFNSYSPKTQKWEQLNLMNQIPPRYLSAMGPLDQEKVLIFGGYGSITGRQEVSPNFYYDLYSIDRSGLHPEKLWNLGSVDSPFVPTHALISDSSSGSFYTLIYNPVNFLTSLTLANFSVDEPVKTLYADSIPYKFLDTESWSTLFLNKKDSKLIAVTTYDTEVDLYSLAYPPLLPQDVYQEESTAYSKMEIWSGLLLTGFVILISGLWFVTRRTKDKSGFTSPAATKAAEEFCPLTTRETTHRKTVSAIYLLGEFQVFDENGCDITSGFTPTLKQLFLLMFLSSAKKGKGVSSLKLDEVLWYDKTGESARNNRNVNISKLRVLLKSIGHIDLEYNNTSWKISLGDHLYADYNEAAELINKSKSAAGLQEEEILRLIHVASSGELCPNIQTEWMDKFKEDFSNELINTLLLLSAGIPENKPDKNNLLLAISDCILRFDVLNEDAIANKCTALFKSGKKNIAMQSYVVFCREYKQLLGVDFTFTFKDLVNSK